MMESGKSDVGFKPIYNLKNESTTEEVKNVYSGWVNTYEKHDIHLNSRILDIGAGTGLAGQHLSVLGYTNVDALDLSKEMLDVAESKNVYQKCIHAGLGLGSTVISSLEKYDGVISSACFTLGHIKAPAFSEMANLVRKGGIITFNARQDAIEDPNHGYSQAIEAMEKDKSWKILLKRKTGYFLYPFGDERARYCYLYVCERL